MGKLQLHGEIESDGINCKRRRGKKEHCAKGDGRKSHSFGAWVFPAFPSVPRKCVEHCPFILDPLSSAEQTSLLGCVSDYMRSGASLYLIFSPQTTHNDKEFRSDQY